MCNPSFTLISLRIHLGASERSRRLHIDVHVNSLQFRFEATAIAELLRVVVTGFGLAVLLLGVHAHSTSNRIRVSFTCHDTSFRCRSVSVLVSLRIDLWLKLLSLQLQFELAPDPR